MPVLDLERLKTLPPVAAHKVPIPELDGEIYVAELTADERDLRIDIGWAEHKKARDAEKKAKGLLNGHGSVVDESNVSLTSWIAAACLCDEQRQFMCGDLIEVSKGCEALATLKASVVQRIATKAQEVNAVGAAELEAIEKN